MVDLGAMRGRFLAALGLSVGAAGAVGCQPKVEARAEADAAAVSPDAAPVTVTTASPEGPADAAPAEVPADASMIRAADASVVADAGKRSGHLLTRGQSLEGFGYCIPAERFAGGQDASGRFPLAICAKTPFESGADGLKAGERPGDDPVGGMHAYSPDEQATRRARTRFANACCYQISRPPRGRPFRVEDEPVLPDVLRGAADEDALAALPGAAEAAAAWLEAAREEQASVAAFASFAARLAQHHAPPGLVCLAEEARLDEMRHAAEALAVARRYGSRAAGFEVLEPGPAPNDLPTDQTLAALAIETFLDGCVGESVAAAEARIAAESAVDPFVKGVLERVAADEERHAELGWRTVRWAIAVLGPELVDELTTRLPALVPDAAVGSDASALEDALAQRGMLSVAARRHVMSEVVERVVKPVLAALVPPPHG